MEGEKVAEKRIRNMKFRQEKQIYLFKLFISQLKVKNYQSKGKYKQE